MNDYAGLPMIRTIDETRRSLYETSHNPEIETGKQILSWLGHKAVTVVAIPANIAEAGLCVAVGFPVAIVLGVVKIAVFAFTVGNYKIEQSTGMVWFSERAAHGIKHILQNAVELSYDTLSLSNQVLDRTNQLFEIIDEEIEMITEQRKTYFHYSHHYQNIVGGNNQIDYWFRHKVLTILSVPVNLIKTSLSTAGCILSTAQFALSILSLGTVEEEHSPGFVWFAGRAIWGIYDILCNAAELTYDVLSIANKVVDKANHILQQPVADIETFTKIRNDLFKTSHNWDGLQGAEAPSTAEKIGCWIGQKALTVLTLPANLIQCGVAAAGCVLSVAQLGFYILSLGTVEGEESPGFFWFSGKVLGSGLDVILNGLELIYDAGNLVYQIFERIAKGIAKAAEGEHPPHYEIPQPLCALDDLTKAHRIDYGAEERSLDDIFKHYAFSLANIPLNAAIAASGAVASVGFSAAFLSKATLYAATNIELPLPTYAGQAILTTVAATDYVARDVANDLADVPVLLYKFGSALNIYEIMVKPLDVIKYIPEAFA